MTLILSLNSRRESTSSIAPEQGANLPKDGLETKGVFRQRKVDDIILLRFITIFIAINIMHVHIAARRSTTEVSSHGTAT